MGPWTPSTPRRLGSGSGVSLVPPGGAVTPSGSGIADMSEGLPFKHLAHYDHLAMPPGPSRGQSRPLSPLLALLENEGPERGGEVPEVTSRGRTQAQTPSSPSQARAAPHTGHLVAVPVPIANHVRLQDARAGAQRGRRPVHRHRVRAEHLHRNVLWAPGLGGCNQRQGHGQPPEPRPDTSIPALPRAPWPRPPAPPLGHRHAPSLSLRVLIYKMGNASQGVLGVD